MRVAALLLGCALLAGSALAAQHLEREVAASSCGDLVGDVSHALAEARVEGGEVLVDLDAHAWRLDEPAVYRRAAHGFDSDERYRVGDGAVRVRIALQPEAGRFAAEVLPEPAGDFPLALAQYLPGIELPCRAEGRIVLTPAPGSKRRPEDAAAVHELLRRATELLYDQRFVAAESALSEAQRLEPQAATVRWMRARVAYLEGESLEAGDRAGRLEAFSRAERLADEAVALAPEEGEGWLWRGIARGRITTTQAGLRRAFDVLRGERGPLWVAQCFDRAIALQPAYAHFGFSAAGDARAGAAQLYRLLPAGVWAQPVIGVARDLDRAVALSREALALQPVRLEYAKELGVALLCRAGVQGDRRDLDEGQRVLRAALELPVRTPYERTDHHHAEELLASNPERACGYSRDAWDAGTQLAEMAP
jgi:tetratricopeptide (TPR) repeat protein